MKDSRALLLSPLGEFGASKRDIGIESPAWGPKEKLIMQNQVPEKGIDDLLGLKDEIIEVLNQLKGISEELQKGHEVANEKVNALMSRGETLSKKIGSLEGMEQAGEEFWVHIQKIGQAIKDLKNFDALKKENLVTGVKF